MLLILIPIAWLAVVTVFVAVCQASASGEAAATGEERPYRVSAGLVVWDRDAAIALRYAGGRAKSSPARQRASRAARTPRSADRLPVHSPR
jgi:hypothetical protein